ncbi:MAG: hypothetical protein Q4C65_13895 [Eubacteriales bacterium]|nr:hypothetical protein [Eubacteriales bacterium]
MRKRQAAMVLGLALLASAGCAPGDISRYAARAQQAGEVIFEGKTTEAMAAAATAAAAETIAREDAAAGETAAESAAAAASQAGTEETAASVPEETAEAAGSAENSAAERAELPALMEQVPREAQDALARKGEDFSGKLAGRDILSRAEQGALEAVLRQEDYGDDMLCLQEMARYSEGNESFLLVFESTPLTARQRVQGDLWFYDGQTARKLLDDTVFEKMERADGPGAPFLLLETEQDRHRSAMVYTVSEGQARSWFEGAAEAELVPEGLCVSYPADYFQYDPLVKEWADAGEGALVPGFYARTQEGFEPLQTRELSAQEYLAYLQPGEGDAEGQAFLEAQEELFYTPSDETADYAYRFFAVGENRVGWRLRRTGLPENGGIDHAVAEYSYAFYELKDGRLTADAVSVGGRGFWFQDPSRAEEELLELSELPPSLQGNRLDRAGELRPAEQGALERIRSVRQYPEDALCFVSAADFDRDGRTEVFAAVGSYDGAFGAAVCDFWCVGDGEPQLLLENRPVRELQTVESGAQSAVLLRGFSLAGVRDLLYTAWDNVPARLLDTAGRIEPQDGGSLKAWPVAGGVPGYFFLQDGQAPEYGLEEIPAKTILEYDNGEAVYRSLLRRADGGTEGLFCLRRANGMLHVSLREAGGTFYETYEVRDRMLVLTDSGEGGYSAGETGEQETEEEN